MSIARSSTWSDATKARFTRLWNEGRPIKIIAEAMAMPKNTVPGTAQRLGLEPRGTPIGNGGSACTNRDQHNTSRPFGARNFGPTRKEGYSTPNGNDELANAVPPKRGMRADLEALPVSRNVLPADLQHGECAFPTQSTDLRTASGFRYMTEHRRCGHPVFTGSRYCAGHTVIAHNPPALRLVPARPVEELAAA